MKGSAWFGLLVLVVAGCGQPPEPKTSTPKNVSRPPERDERLVHPPSPAAAAPPAASPTFSLRLGRAWTFSPRRVLVSPVPGRTTGSDLARVHLDLVEGTEWEVVLDDQAPRPFFPAHSASTRSRELAAFVLEDRELSPGGHVVTVFRRLGDPPSVEFESATFLVDAPEMPRAELPLGCLLLSPGGTHYGAAASRGIEILPLPLCSSVRDIRLSVVDAIGETEESADEKTLELPPGQAAVLSSESSGDFRIELSCSCDEDVSPTTVVRTIVVNRDWEPPRAEGGPAY